MPPRIRPHPVPHITAVLQNKINGCFQQTSCTIPSLPLPLGFYNLCMTPLPNLISQYPAILPSNHMHIVFPNICLQFVCNLNCFQTFRLCFQSWDIGFFPRWTKKHQGHIFLLLTIFLLLARNGSTDQFFLQSTA